MTEKDYTRYCAIEVRLKNDDEMKVLKHRLEAASADLDSVLSRLSNGEQAAVTEYLGILAEIQQRIVELACFEE